MDSVRKKIVTDDMYKLINSLTIFEGTKEEMDTINAYVEITRHLWEIYQWYDIFEYNYEMIKSLYPNGSMAAINSHTIALVSAGKNLVSAIELCIKKSLDEDERKDFHEEYVSREYDNNFSYRLLDRLRNYSQHEHIPVSTQEGMPCFDLYQIYNTPDYNFNCKLEKESEDLMGKIAEELSENLVLSYNHTISAYICSVFRIYEAFMEKIDTILRKKVEEFQKVYKKQPKFLEHENHPELRGYFCYIIEEEENGIHMINTKDAPHESHLKRLIKAKNKVRVEEEHLKKLHDTLVSI